MTLLFTLISNTFWRSVAEIVSRVASALFWILIARYLGADPLGSIAFAFSLFSFFELISSLGLGTVLTREVAKNKNQASRYFGHALVSGTVSAIFFTFVLFGAVAWLKPNSSTAVNCWIMASVLPLSGIAYFSRAMLIADEKMIFVTVASFCENLLQLMVGWFLLKAGHGSSAIVWVMVAGKALASAILFVFAVSKVAWPAREVDKTFLRVWLAHAPSFLLIVVLNGLFWSITVILLTKIAGEVETGYYSAAFKLVSFFLMFSFAYGQALLPLASRLMDDHQMGDFYAKLLRKSLKYIFICSLAVAASLSLLAEQVMVGLYGQSMMAAAKVLRWLAWLLVPYAAIPVLASTLVSYNHQRLDLLANFAGTLTLTLMIFLLVPQWGAMGAAVAMVVGSSIFFLVEFWAVQCLIFPLDMQAELWRPLGGVVLMAFCLFYLRSQHLWLGVIIGSAIYLLMLYVTGSLNIHELRILKSYFLHQLY